eukprot:TRINITY_DN3081_c0_g1_i1.p1 TRINITY_DN3081_c0_g1~~TRINITY_DN3081_c0_g1_i1.p1  ORF type:complete len:172 (+),score=39.69 TRINITY_DN3081_c0_g1_i1:64-579(+)
MVCQRSLVYVAVAVLYVLPACLCHVCMWSPMQRGGKVDISMPGADLCYMVKGAPCGGSSIGSSLTELKGNSVFMVEFQQNLNHWYPPNPGYMIADITTSANSSTFSPFGHVVPDYNARDMVTQTNFTISGTVPNVDCKGCVLRVRYVSNNPDEGKDSNIFYQCADVNIHAN